MMGHWVKMGQWVNQSRWAMGQWVMGHVYDGSDGSWVTKSDPWSTLIPIMFAIQFLVPIAIQTNINVRN